MINFTFSKDNRLLKKNDFQSLRDDANFLYQNSILFFYKRNNLSETRVGFSISKKIGKAHLRNRYRRILKESFRLSSFKNHSMDIHIVLNSKQYRSLVKKCNSFEEILKADFLKGLRVIVEQ